MRHLPSIPLGAALGAAVLLGACSGDDCDTEPVACPAAEDRFTPNLLPEENYTSGGFGEDNGPCEPPPGLYDGYCLITCNESWCADGYVGRYCVTSEHFRGWAGVPAEGVCYGRFGDSGLQVCSVFCTAE